MYFLKLIASAVLAVTLTGLHASAQVDPGPGNCNIIAKNIFVGNNSTYIQVVECNPVDPAKSFAVRYVSLDATNISFLMAGYTEKVLEPILGKSALTLKHSLYESIAALYRDYGERVSENGFPTYSFYGNKLFGDSNGGIQEEISFSDLPEQVRRRLRFYSGEEPIIWPQLRDSMIVRRSDGWPTNWRMTYMKEGGRVTTAVDAFNCAALYNFITRAEAAAYWDDAQAVQAASVDRSLSRDYATPPERKVEGRGEQSFKVGHLGLRAIQAVADGPWPLDYLLRVGRLRVEGCGANTFGFYAYPRKLFVLVGIVTAIGPSISIDGIEYKVDLRTELRKDVNETIVASERFPEQTLQRGQSLIIPLRMELRYDFDDEPVARVRDNQVSRAQYLDIAQLKDARFSSFVKGKRWISKFKSSFRPAEFSEVTRSYIAGEARSLSAVMLMGSRYAVKSAPRTAVVAIGQFDGGSCPFLSIKAEDGDWSVNGRVLIGANQPEKLRSERIPIPARTKAIRIEEREPEVSYIRTLSIINKHGQRSVLSENLKIRGSPLLHVGSLRSSLPAIR